MSSILHDNWGQVWLIETHHMFHSFTDVSVFLGEKNLPFKGNLN